MFGLFRRKKAYEQQSWDLFLQTQDAARDPYFYEYMMVPDTTEGRFDLLLVHIFLIIHRLKTVEKGQEMGQALFDTAFQSIDQGYREIGVGDMGVPKRMKKLMLAFNGRMHAYDAALEADEDALKDALDRNIYNMVRFEDDAILTQMTHYVMRNHAYLQTQDTQDIMQGTVRFLAPEDVRNAGIPDKKNTI